MQRIDLCFRLDSPIHIGFGRRNLRTVIADTRPFVPGKTLWGAIVNSFVNRLYVSPVGKNYREIGNLIRNNIKFSYLFPLDKYRTPLTLLCPRFPEQPGEPVHYGNLNRDEFQREFIHSRVSTSIEDSTAAEGSLHEIRYIRQKLGNKGADVRPVYLAGYAFLNDNNTDFIIESGTIIFREQDIFTDIRLGGERNYGFGLISMCCDTNGLKEVLRKVWPFEHNNCILSIKKNESFCIPGHCMTKGIDWISGEVEYIAERETNTDSGSSGSDIASIGLHLIPGSLILGSTKIEMDSFGRFRKYGLT